MADPTEFDWQRLSLSGSVSRMRSQQAGRCLTTFLGLRLGAGEPAFKTILELTNTWFDILAEADRELLDMVRSAWPTAKSALQIAKHPIDKVTGIMSNVIYILL